MYQESRVLQGRDNACIVSRCDEPTIRGIRRFFLAFVLRLKQTPNREYHYGCICAKHFEEIFGKRSVEECLWSFGEARIAARNSDYPLSKWVHMDEPAAECMPYLKCQRLIRVQHTVNEDNLPYPVQEFAALFDAHLLVNGQIPALDEETLKEEPFYHIEEQLLDDIINP